ncbi:LysR family transcriptional regulator [Thalassotalea ponticola]|uniref:LysR family transcriptional regulator n=1 Tax=Thalassotalea ponticola TaxID=1523392 RepID=UPI0025B56A6E|nr:LysR family transcriptional regulator [Thalassotalea ponticola]MDN3653737.1 LysR family transcriptional regulator [Thalassotalea ponticola]
MDSLLRITLEQWRMFRAVVKYGGFNQAATHIHKSQSSVHSAVSKIEDSLNIKLLEVEGRKTVLTEAGEKLLQRADYLLQEAAKLEAVGLTLAKGEETTLRVAVEEIFPVNILYQVLENVSAQYPQLNIEIRECILGGARELLEQDEVDLAISPFRLSGGFSEQLTRIVFQAVAHPEHALHQIERPLTIEDLKAHRQIVVRDSALHTNTDAGWLGAEQRWTVSHMRSSIDIIKNGLGYAWLPISSINQELQSNQLKTLNLSFENHREAALYLIFKDGDSLGPAARTFLAELRYLC